MPLDLAWLGSVAAFSLAAAATPGPNNAMVAASGATWGVARTWPHVLGIAIGFPVMFVAVALGAGTLLRDYPAVHRVLTWVGAAYMLWLAWRIATARPAPREGDGRADAKPAPARGRPMSFLEGALFQWVNPKAWIIVVGAIATYTETSAMLAQAAVMAVVVVLVTVPSCLLWTAIGAGAARLLRTERSLRAFNIVMAILLVASLIPIVAG
jgi:threonine/homoserine/homoserine lactone efflux protein